MICFFLVPINLLISIAFPPLSKKKYSSFVFICNILKSVIKKNGEIMLGFTNIKKEAYETEEEMKQTDKERQLSPSR